MTYIPCPLDRSKGADQVLSSTLGGLQNGCGADLGTRFITVLAMGRDLARGVVADLVWSFCQLSIVFPWLREVELAQRAKHGSYSLRAGYSERPPADPKTGVVRDSLQMGVQKYFALHITAINHSLLKAATKQVRGWIRKGSLHAMSTPQAAIAFRKKASCGWPYFVSAAASPWEYLHIAERIRNDGYDLRNARTQPGVLGVRGQPAGPGQFAKNRAIYAFPRGLNILMKQIFQPTFDRLSQHPYFAAWRSRHDVDKGVTRIFGRVSGRAILSVDFSNFDATVPFELIGAAFDVLRHWFDHADHACIDFCEEAFKRTGIICPGEFYQGELRMGGIPSGAVLTNLIGSIVNYLAVSYACMEQGGRIVDALLQGDDGVYVFEGVHSLRRVCDVLLSHLGLIMSPDKCLYHTDMVTFLQNVHHRSFVDESGLHVGIRPIMRVLNGMMSYEKPRKRDGSWLPVMDSFRWLQQLDNASAHPSFRLMCRWLLRHDEDGMLQAMNAIRKNDLDLLVYTDAILGSGDENKTRVCDLYRSQVVRCCTELLVGD